MDIYLIKDSHGVGDTHAAINRKKTGCGIKLNTDENIGKYVQEDIVEDLSRVTCVACKQLLADKIIKNDRKVLSKLFRAEKIARLVELGKKEL